MARVHRDRLAEGIVLVDRGRGKGGPDAFGSTLPGRRGTVGRDGKDRSKEKEGEDPFHGLSEQFRSSGSGALLSHAGHHVERGILPDLAVAVVPQGGLDLLVAQVALDLLDGDAAREREGAS
jgi:hypothetical protein